MIDYDDYLSRERSRMGKIRAKIENQFEKRVPRQKPVAAHKEALLTSLDKKRWERMIQNGSIVVHSPRHMTVRVFET